ncbi:superoxide dismutase family protein [Nonomuraea sp. NPDC000554]|uniref:superoxide dismutase family protein n=1 Tax=Nonomuraea sp. NPDC000554 TaxID=3154259 RepID=UPI0033287BF6
MRLPALLLVLLTASCATAPAVPDVAPTKRVVFSGSGQLAPGDKSAIVYDSKLVPEGAQVSLTAEEVDGGTLTSMVVEGFLPAHTYGAHLHANACGLKPEAAGPHYQHQHGQANAASEVWLDVTTDDSGSGRATARNEWVFDRSHLPRSLVIHAGPTQRTGSNAGEAGARVACLNLH